uniref:WSC domain-containing protein n=1 Tax=Kwoniella dejecticola CBS 10117 TaxID=1296121 RepID=A0A1A5ZWK5_9TREE|nr:uncharacterized protein I303_08100 [Kwoniella dejecticola CBS 10117]OBR82186.1 hypothetical protein I303_08100 [Kwoniella dejecticola CBS 10117]
MHLSTVLVAAVACVSSVNAHVALWDKGMFGLNYPYQADDPQNQNYNNNEPVIPLKQADGRTTAQWFGHGLLGYPPKSGDFMYLPSGGTYNGEVSCNRAQTALGSPYDNTPKYKYACKPDGGQYSGVGALHVMNTYNGTVDNKWFGGSALAIAYTSDVGSLQPNDMTVISVNQNSVWEREISYQIPAGMPPCPSGGCLCSWNWIHQGGHVIHTQYNVVYRCQVTGSTDSANTVQKGAVPNKCDGNPAGCVKGPKTPMYLWQADGNNLPNLDTPPNYRDNWGFADGAQNDIFTPAATPASSGTPKATATALPSGWSSVGCMVDDVNLRALPGSSYSDPANNTIQACVASCAKQGYNFAGVEYGQECWCSNTATLTSAPDSDCNMVCPGDIWSNCGASSRINVYRSAKAPTTGQATVLPDSDVPAGWSSLGCMVDDQSNRALNDGSTSSDTNSVEECIATCGARGLPYAGVEYGKECWCGSTARLVSATSGCDKPCQGDPAHICGGSDRLNVYFNQALNTTSTSTSASSTSASASASGSISAFISSTIPVTASSSAAVSTSSSPMVNSTTAVETSSSTASSSSAVSSVASASSSSAFPSVSSSVSSSAPASSISTSSISSLPSASSTSVQGSSAKPTLAISSSTPSSVASSSTSSLVASTSTSSSAAKSSTSTSSLKPSTTSSSTTSTTVTSTTTSAAATATTSLPAGWVSRGCYVDSSSSRILVSSIFENKSDMTYAQCIATCTRKGYSIAGVEYGTQCFCANTLTNPVPAVASTCDRPCAGDKATMCGGYNRISILQNTAVKRRSWGDKKGRPHSEMIKRRNETGQ